MLLRGHVVEGCNHFEGRMTRYADVSQERTGQRLYPGTINLRVDRPIPVKEDFRIRGGEIGEPEQDLIFEHCRISGRDAFRIRPFNLRTGSGGHGDDTLEIACSEQIPGVVTGAEFEVELFRDDIDGKSGTLGGEA